MLHVCEWFFIRTIFVPHDSWIKQQKLYYTYHDSMWSMLLIKIVQCFSSHWSRGNKLAAMEKCIIIIPCLWLADEHSASLSWQLTTREMQCVPGSCLGATQCLQRAVRLQSVRFLYLSVSSLLLSERTVSHCAGLLVLSWNPKHPSWAAVDLGDCPCSDIGLPVGNMDVSVSFCSFPKHGYCSRCKIT